RFLYEAARCTRRGDRCRISRNGSAFHWTALCGQAALVGYQQARALTSDTQGRPLVGVPIFSRPISSFPEALNAVSSFIVRSRMNWKFNDALSLTYLAGYQRLHWLTQYDESNGAYGVRLEYSY